MAARKKTRIDPLARALQAEREGVEFFEHAQVVTQNPRVRELFEKLARQKREHASSLEETFKELHLVVPEASPRADFFPMEELRKAECYVCGYVTESGLVPESCPRCGASRYAFEKEISIKKAWELAERGAISTIKVLTEAEKDADVKSKSRIAKHIQLEQRFLNEARKELESLRK